MQKLRDTYTKIPHIFLAGLGLGVILVLIGVGLLLQHYLKNETKPDTKQTPTITSSFTQTPVAPSKPTEEQQEALALLNAASQGLISTHISSEGWTWKSAIQSPHQQTDRDVGVAGIGMGFLVTWQATGNPIYLDAAKQSGDWIISIGRKEGNTMSWPDYADPDDTSEDYFTSFDDGTPGIADFLWQLGSATKDITYTNAAIAGMQWELKQAQGIGNKRCPQEQCRWIWANNHTSYQTGMGEGLAGIIYALDVFAERTGDNTYEQYAKAGAAYLESILTPDGAMPETAVDTHYDTGFLSGAAGGAFMYLRLYEHSQNSQYLSDAKKLLSWVYTQKRAQTTGIAWPIMIDPTEGNNETMATGIEEGNAGIGWVALQAYTITGDQTHLNIAKQAGDWLLAVGHKEGNGISWPEDVGKKAYPTHTSLDNGAPGIGWFLHDLFLATGDHRYEDGALGAMHWLDNTAQKTGTGAFWYENRTGTTWNIFKDPSWHWGSAGIAGFLSRMSGGTIDMPGEESAL